MVSLNEVTDLNLVAILKTKSNAVVHPKFSGLPLIASANYSAGI
jgi:hypothetical protein